jgi:hypothetical protein
MIGKAQGADYVRKNLIGFQKVIPHVYVYKLKIRLIKLTQGCMIMATYKMNMCHLMCHVWF